MEKKCANELLMKKLSPAPSSSWRTFFQKFYVSIYHFRRRQFDSIFSSFSDCSSSSKIGFGRRRTFCSSSSHITSKWFFQHWWAPCLLPRLLVVCWKQAAFYYVPERQNAEQFTFQRPSQTFKSTNSFCCWFRYTKSSLGLFRANFEADDDASNKLE